MAFRWPTDPAGKPAAHTKSWEDHQAALKSAQATPAAAAPSPLPLIEPPDPIYTQEIEGLGAKFRSDYAASREQRRRGLLDYGYTENEDTGGLTFDASNPFSRAALLKQNYDRQRASAGQSMASSGQLYSGAYQNTQDTTNRAQLGAEDELQKSLGAFLLGNTGEQQQLTTDYGLSLIGADEKRLGRINDNPLYSPTVSAADAAAVTPPAGGIGQPTTSTKKVSSITAGPGVKPTKNTTVSKKKKGRTITYTTSTTRP